MHLHQILSVVISKGLSPWQFWNKYDPRAKRQRICGSGIVIATVDTGIDKDLAVFDYEGKIHPKSKSFISDDINDTDGHGTYCAGIAAGVPVYGTEFNGGVASRASLLICKVSDKFSDSPDNFTCGTVIQALEYIRDQHKNNVVKTKKISVLLQSQHRVIPL